VTATTANVATTAASAADGAADQRCFGVGEAATHDGHQKVTGFVV